MNPERNPKSASIPETGRFATLSSLLPAKGTGAPSLRLLAILTLAATAAIASIAPSLAQAHQARLFSSSFGAATSTPANPYPLGSAAGNTAVDASSHDLYVSDVFNHRVEKFGPAGEFLFMIGDEVNSGTGNPNLCTNAGAPTDVCQAGTPTTAPGGFQSFDLPLAVDNSPGGEGDLYVGDRTGQLVSKFDSDGHLITSWGNNGPLETPNGQLNGANATAPIAGPFGPVEGVAVDLSGNLWVYAGATVFEFHQDGSFAENGWLAFPSGGAIAVDSEDNLYFGHGHVPKYNATGTPLGNVFGGSNEETTTSLAVDPSTDELYLGVNLGNSVLTFAVQRFDSSCHPSPEYGAPPCAPVESFDAGRGGINGLTLDPSTHALYAAETESKDKLTPAQVRVFAIQTVPDVLTAKATGFSAGAATLNGTVNPDGVPLTECFFEWGETTAYGHSAECEPNAAALGSGKSPLAVHADITGLEAGHTYHFRLVAANANDVNSLIDQPERGADLAFGPPAIESASALDVAATGATLEAQVNPNNVDTSTRIEYVTQAQFELNGFSEALTTPDADLGSGGSSQNATFEISGLTPATAYRYRALAASALGASEGPALTFTTQATVPFALPDHRGWEMVSPPEKGGGNLISFPERGVIQAATGGDAIAYLSSAPFESSAQGNSQSYMSVLSARGPSGWRSHDLVPPKDSATGAWNPNEYRFYSADLSRSILQPFGRFSPSISPEATEQTAFLRTDFPATEPTAFCTTACYRPLVSAANVTPEGAKVSLSDCHVEYLCGPYFLGASPDASHIALFSAAPLLEGAPVGEIMGGQETGSVYEWSDGQLQLISIRPGPAGPAPASVEPTLGTHRTGGIHGSARTAISDDGSRVVWSEAGGALHLYLRDTAVEETIQLDLKQPSATGKGDVAPVFQIASADGSRIFFTDRQQLTADASKSGADLYRCQIVEGESGQLSCQLTDLTPEPSPGEPAAVQGGVIGAAEDGSSIYFVANGILAHNTVDNGAGEEEAHSGTCLEQQAQPPGATCNLYVSRQGQVSFIASLSGAESGDWSSAVPPEPANLSGMPARVSPDGNWLTFMSERPLTGYDNRDVATGESDQEVFLYHAPAGAGEEGQLICASCNPTGARPRGVEFDGANGAPGHRVGFDLGFHQGVAASVPGWIQIELGFFLYQPPYLADGGRLFFDSSDPLVPQDTNGTQDVYSYEPPQGEGAPPGDTCTIASPTFSPASGGCVGLISSGTSPAESAFLGASASGSDVFFLTNAQLSRRDLDTAADVYDARVDGGEAEPVKPVECEGDGCQLPAVPANFETPGTSLLDGPGNLTECPTGKVKRSGKCVAKKHKKARRKHHGAKHKRAANANRRASR